jgi:uncharacterized protein
VRGTLTDAGPLVALGDTRDGAHRMCVQALPGITVPLVTTLPVVTETMYLLGRRIGWRAQRALLEMVDRGKIEILPTAGEEFGRIATLMEQYRDVPMDFADASMVAAAESLETRRIFTLDRHFQIYRWRGRRPFEVVP